MSLINATVKAQQAEIAHLRAELQRAKAQSPQHLHSMNRSRLNCVPTPSPVVNQYPEAPTGLASLEETKQHYGQLPAQHGVSMQQPENRNVDIVTPASHREFFYALTYVCGDCR